jgi:uncharacterized protein YecT (DUF1311 family)
MRFFPESLRRNTPACLNKPAKIIFICCVLFAGNTGATASGQQPDESQPAPPPAPAAFQNRIPASQLTFLNEYAGKTAKEIRKDKRFRALMKLAIPRTEYHYGRDMPLSETVETLLDGAPMPIDIHDGRYAMISSHSGPYLSGKGFLWFDMQEGVALGGVYFHPVNGEPTPTLAIFSRQLTDRALLMGQLPLAFQQDLAQWILVADPRWVSPRYFIPEDGKKYVLVHDEDYCAYAPSAPHVSAGKCEQLNAEAADADLDAAYFMAQTHNAANATAWMRGPDQIAWIGLRDRTCAASGFACRIRVTRQRTRVLLGTQRN